MAEIEKKEICKCTHCGNEAEMMFTCSLEDHVAQDNTADDAQDRPAVKKAKGTATCSHCGNEAEMWIDL